MYVQVLLTKRLTSNFQTMVNRQHDREMPTHPSSGSPSEAPSKNLPAEKEQG